MKTKPKSCLEFFEIHLNLTPEKDLPLIRNRTGDIHSKINCELLLLKMEKLCNETYWCCMLMLFMLTRFGSWGLD
ncbi:hypothetical protein OUZ56_024561 [Daphnia magna]|uniref:Uncharacterized protein n=1 Tax=Daphnia magna TaxID=35525 RepID=A0ABR0B148_9CRUS|nr:hypothetical protein OUZ56_024561 [Daphnia magna]